MSDSSAAVADMLRSSVGIELRRFAPARQFNGDASKKSAKRNWEWRSVRHLTAVLQGRPVDLICCALGKLGQLRALADCARFTSECKRIVRGAMDVIVERWSDRLSVYLWDRLQLSRRKMDTLRNLLSRVYRTVSDSYDPIIVWQNPFSSADRIAMPCLVGRAGRQALFNKLADEGEITVGENGRCERDAGRCATQLYSRFSQAMRNDFSRDRPARPIFYFDGTGGSLGRGIGYAELGSADFAGDCKQSRATLNPLNMWPGNDHALPLRENLDETMRSFNALSAVGELELDDGECVPCEPIVVGDMQGIKCIMGMTETCHSVRCKCRARAHVDGGDGPQHDYGEPDSQFNTYDEYLQFLDGIGCAFKSEDFLLANAHLSKGLFYGGSFTPFECPSCGYKPTAAQAKADLARFKALTDEERENERREHVRGGSIGMSRSSWGRCQKASACAAVGTTIYTSST